MLESAKEILNILNSNNYKAYIVGGYVRDKLIGIESKDIDICTSAKPEELKKIFSDAILFEEYGAIKLNYNNYYFDITSFRKDINYDGNRRNLTIEYVDNIEEDILRRDFIINTLYMDSNESIIDLFGAKRDIDNKIIRLNGNSQKLIEDPLRILRAIKYAVKLNFKLDSTLFDEIIKYSEYLTNLSYYRKKEALEEIFKYNNLNYTFKLFDELNLKKYLDINYKNVKYCSDTIGIWAQIEFSNEYPFNKTELRLIDDLRVILKMKKIDNYTVYKYGIDLSKLACEILDINQKEVDFIYNNLPIKNVKDINISFNELKEIVKNYDLDTLNNIYKEIEIKILNNELLNEKDKIIEYIKKVGDINE